MIYGVKGIPLHTLFVSLLFRDSNVWRINKLGVFLKIQMGMEMIIDYIDDGMSYVSMYV